VRFAAFLTSMLSAGRLAWRHNNLLFIMQTARAAQAEAPAVAAPLRAAVP
jgi:hypothetical protein